MSLTLADCNLGDIVAAEVDGETVYLEVSNLLTSKGSKKRPSETWGALVNPVSSQSLLVEESRAARVVDPGIAVVAIVQTGLERRENDRLDRDARMRRRGIVAHEDRYAGDEVDPLRSKTDTGSW